MEPSVRISCLKNMPMFQELDKSALQAIALHFQPAYFRPRVSIFRENDPALHVFFLVSGSVRLVRYKEDAKAIIVHCCHQTGDFFAESSLSEDVHLMDAEAAKNSVVLKVRSDVLHDIFRQYPAVHARYTKILNRRNTDLVKHLIVLAHSNASTKITMAMEIPETSGLRTQQAWADYCGMARESVSRTKIELLCRKASVPQNQYVGVPA